MDAKINIAKILKDKPEGTKLWTDMFGSVTLYVVTDACDAFQVKHHNKEPWFDKDGKLCKEGVLCIYPSKSMRDWSKFAWKKGDLLVSNDGGTEVIFDKWYDDTYTNFYGKHYLNSENKNKIMYYEEFICTTERYSFQNKDVAQTYINTIEKKLGGKLNRETLEIEKLEFNDGDIVTITFNWGEDIVYIFKSEDSNSYSYYAWLNGSIPTIIEISHPKSDIYTVRLSTEAEKQKLFEALAKEGKAWDSEKKAIVDLKQKDELKPFDKVLVRNTDTEEWFPGFFEKFDSTWNNPYHIMNRRSMTDFAFKQCIPYEGNESLLGTTKDVEG